MSRRIHPLWWPLLALTWPLWVPVLRAKEKPFIQGEVRARWDNENRIQRAGKLDLPVLTSLSVTPVVEHRVADGFYGDPGVSYLLRSDLGTVLMDVGFGPATRAFAHNWRKLGLRMDALKALVISHLHLDHMGGLKAQRRKQVLIPPELAPKNHLRCYVPDECDSPFFRTEQLENPVLLPGGFATTGPLSRMLFFNGYTNEQSLVARVKDKGLVVIVGCGHPTFPVIFRMVRQLSDEPLYAVVGGLHFPITGSSSRVLGIQVQQIFGTGKKWNDPITNKDMTPTVRLLQDNNPQRLLLSAHDSCDYALSRFEGEIDTKFTVLETGRTYPLA